MKKMIVFMLASLLYSGTGYSAFIPVSERSVLSDFVELEISFPSLPHVCQENDFLCGDVNEDGMVNVLDIISLVNHIMGGNPSPFDLEAADINADAGINILDIIALVNIIMQVQGIPCGCVAPVVYGGQTYTTVQIGDQCWFRENLNVGAMIFSDYPGRYQQTDNGIIEKYCYNNDPAQCELYAGLYEWPEAMQYVTTEGAQGICPVEWHIPTDNEWKVLEGTLDSQFPIGDPEWDYTGWRGQDAGGSLKEIGTINWTPPNSGANNESGFTGLPGGYRDGYGYYFMGLGNFGQFWSSSECSAGYTWSRELYYEYPTVHRLDYDKANGFSIRCLKGCWPEPTQAHAGPDQLNIAGTSTTLAGNTPIEGDGLWAIVSGTGATIVSPSNPTSQFQGVADQEYVLSWTVSTICGSSSDMVTISFASDGTFECGDMLMDVRDGQSYETVQIGYQCWMAQNLNIGTMVSGTIEQSNNGTMEKYCYNNDEGNCNTYGGLYSWDEAMQYSTTEGVQGICPADWHLPTDEQWSVLNDFLGGSTVAGGKMKSTGNTGNGTGLWYPPNTGATNESGFTGLPGGYREAISGTFKTLTQRGYFWSSTTYTAIPIYSWNYRLHYINAELYRSYAGKEDGRSVRCIYACEPLPSQAEAGPDQTIYGTSTTLAGNTPSTGTGAWTILSGTGGTITDPASPTSDFQGLACTTYALSWQICTSCGCTSDTVLISFAPVVSFTCGDILEDCRDGQSYATVQIGDQCWMAKNLNTGTMVVGTIEQSDNGTVEKNCYENESGNCDTYGGLYQWHEAMEYETAEGVRGICPYGWHIPTDGEWTVLTTYLGGNSVAGGKMKSTGTLEEATGLWYAPNTGATNESGFTGLPGGSRSSTGSLFLGIHADGSFWSSSRHYTDFVWFRRLIFNSAAIERSDSTFGDDGFSVRCIRDN
ncbi:MAG TPA: FISUMP domain-containing protein [Bacteroidales bacterium]|nr:FISUMP domain-containing protein [Bacteroidales bacterium]